MIPNIDEKEGDWIKNCKQCRFCYYEKEDERGYCNKGLGKVPFNKRPENCPLLNNQRTKQVKSRRKASRKEIIECNQGTFRLKDGKDKGAVVSGGQRMYISVCAKRSKNKDNEDCYKCTKWIDVIKEEAKGIKVYA